MTDDNDRMGYRERLKGTFSETLLTLLLVP